jgi:CheY-like chemotaxis protein
VERAGEALLLVINDISTEATLASTRMIMLSSDIETDRSEPQRAGVQERLSKPVDAADDSRAGGCHGSCASAGTCCHNLQGAGAGRGGQRLEPDGRAGDGRPARLRGRHRQRGVEALEAVATTRYAAVLMDCHMPVMDGFTATAEIRSREVDGQRLPIIAMTAAATSEDRDRCIAAGMDDYVSKPVDTTVLDNVLDCWARQDAAVISDADEPRPDDSVLDPAQLSVLRRLGPDDGWGVLLAVAQPFHEMWPALVAELRQAPTSGDTPA